MVAISSYYAQVGVGIDKSSLAQVQSYLDSIQKKMERFQTNLSKSKDLTLKINNVSVNQTALRNSIRSAAANTSVRLNNVTVGKVNVVSSQLRKSIRDAWKGGGGASAFGGIRLDNFTVNQKALVSAINSAINVSGRTSKIRIGALLSQGSLSDMRNQIRQSINQLVVSPTINPRINPSVRSVRNPSTGGGSGGGGRASRLTTRNPSSMNPWHNPMMVGGFAGAFMRYGMFSLPFVAGAYGLNTLSKNLSNVQNAELAVRAQVGNEEAAQNQLGFLHRLGNIHGVRMQDVAPAYSQMFAAAQGTVLEPNLQRGFQSFIQYASVIGMNEEQKKGAVLALSQIVGKGGKNFAQELNLQLIKHPLGR